MKNIEQLVNETMESLDGISRPEANPYIYTRIEQRLRNRPGGSVYQRKLMPVLAVALVLFLSLNMLSYFKMNNEPVSVEKPADGIERFAIEYHLSDEGGL